MLITALGVYINSDIETFLISYYVPLHVYVAVSFFFHYVLIYVHFILPDVEISVQLCIKIHRLFIERFSYWTNILLYIYVKLACYNTLYISLYVFYITQPILYAFSISQMIVG